MHYITGILWNDIWSDYSTSVYNLPQIDFLFSHFVLVYFQWVCNMRNFL